MDSHSSKALTKKTLTFGNSNAQRIHQNNQSYFIEDHRPETVIQSKNQALANDRKKTISGQGVAQLLRKDARKFIKDNGLGIEDRLEEIQEYVWNKDNPEEMRMGLRDAWNQGQNEHGRFFISVERPTPSAESLMLLLMLGNMGTDEDSDSSGESEMKEKDASDIKVRYKTIREGWHDKKAMQNHCLTYCNDKSKQILVNAAEALGLPPPMLGHGSDSGKGGTKKDALLYATFKAEMERILTALGYSGRTLDAMARQAIKDPKK